MLNISLIGLGRMGRRYFRILKKNDNFLEVILENTTIKILLKKRNNIYVGNYKEIEFTSNGK